MKGVLVVAAAVVGVIDLVVTLRPTSDWLGAFLPQRGGGH